MAADLKWVVEEVRRQQRLGPDALRLR